MIGRADIDGAYRYSLERRWDESRHFGLTWVMLNPSTADANTDDATIRRVISFSGFLGFGGMTVLNLFAYRSTNPKELLFYPLTKIGPRNNSVLAETFLRSDRIICAWGTHGSIYNRDRVVIGMILDSKRIPECLGKNKDGTPKHPLYLSKSIIPFRMFPEI